MQLIEKLTWTDNLTMYNAKLDDQHKEIFQLVNQIIELEELYPKSEKFAAILSKISDYGLAHFRTEENYMKDIGYAHTDKHIEEHRNYLFQVAMFNTNFKQKDFTKPEVVLKFLRGWWYGHIQQSDMNFSKFLKQSLSS